MSFSLGEKVGISWFMERRPLENKMSWLLLFSLGEKVRISWFMERRPLENKISWSLSFSFDDTSSGLDGGDSGEAGKVCTTTNQPCIGIRLVLCIIIMYYVLCTITNQP